MLFFFKGICAKVKYKQLCPGFELGWLCPYPTQAGARGVMVIVFGNGHGDTSSNPGRG